MLVQLQWFLCGLSFRQLHLSKSLLYFSLIILLFREQDESKLVINMKSRLLVILSTPYKKNHLEFFSFGIRFNGYSSRSIDLINVSSNLILLISLLRLSFLDKAAIVTSDEKESIAKGAPPPNPWRLSTVHRVEELKSVIRMGPIWAAGILVITASAQQNTFSLQQARAMDRRLSPSSSFLIPPGSMSVFTMLAMLLTLTLYDRAVIPLARRATGLRRGLSFLHRMGAGFAFSAAATLVAGFVEVRRKCSGAHPPISVFWLVPQYLLHGVAEALTSVGHLEFCCDQAPESMRSTAAALFWVAVSAGSYGSTLLVSAVHRFSARADGSNWLSDDLNKGRLEYLYWIITMLQGVNLVYFVFCAKYYTFKPVQSRQEEEQTKTKQRS